MPQDLVEDPAVVPVLHLDVFSSVDEPSSHVELSKARVPNFPQELVLQAAVDPPFDRHALCDRLAKPADCAPTEHQDDSTGAVDDGRIGVVDERASDVKAGAEDANKVAKQFHGFAWHSGRQLPVFDRRWGCCVVECPQEVKCAASRQDSKRKVGGTVERQSSRYETLQTGRSYATEGFQLT